MMILGCSRINVAEQVQTPVPDGEMPVQLSVDGMQAQTKSYVSGEEKAITSIKMLCFDAQGKYITVRDAELTPSSTTPATAGTLTGHVPDNTVRIHFVANFSNLDLSEYGMGSLERVMMKSEALSSGIEDEVRFWGFHAEESAADMKTWLVSNKKVMLLRDRAKVTVVNNDPDIASVQWTIVNGLNRGFIAPTNATGSFPYTNDYVNGTLITEYRSSGVYNPAENAENLWVDAGADNPQFLFENSNMSVPVKLIVKVTFKAAEGVTPEVRYHTLLLQDNNKVLYDVFRNASFQLTIENLPSKSEASSMGSDDYDAAVTTENYSNNPYAQVEREVTEISSNEFKLSVEKVVNIFHAKNASGNGVINFTYTALGSASTSGLTPANFSVSWEGKDDTDTTPDMAKTESAPTVAYDATTGKGTVTFAMNDVTTDLKYNAFQITAKNSGLSRFVDLYSITSFAYGVTPTLADNNTTRISGGEVREVYKLDFTLEANYPEGLYPAVVRIYSSSLSPFSDNSATEPHGSFTTVVGNTSALQESSQTTSWNYKAKSWGSWYEYVIQTPSADNKYTIYLNDILANMTTKPTQVGLYFEVVHYGGPTALTAGAHVREIQSFAPSNFTFDNNNNAMRTIGQATVSLTNSDKANYNSTLRIGRDSGTGTINVSVPEGYLITGISITYYDDYYYQGGGTTTSSGTYQISEDIGTWSGDPVRSVTLSMTRDSYYNDSPRITQIQVSYSN